MWRFAGITEQRKAALRRAVDARRLRQQRRWRGAMYLRGYEIECILKARLMERYNCLSLAELEQKLSRRSRRKIDLRTHSIEYLFELTGARPRLVTAQGDRSALFAFQRVNRWTVDWRYDPAEGDEPNCTAFFESADRFVQFISGSA